MWYTILDIVARLAVVTNVSSKYWCVLCSSFVHICSSYWQAFLIAVTAQFIPLLVYAYRDPAPDIRKASPAYRNDNLQKSLGGYVEYTLSPFDVRVLINDDNNPFPLPSAIALNWYNGTDDATNFYFQPYHTNYTCFMGSNWTRPAEARDFPCVPGTDCSMRFPYFEEGAWDRFTAGNSIGDARHEKYRECINESYPCRLVLCALLVKCLWC